MFWHVLLILLAGAGIALYEVPKLTRQKMWRELTAFSGFLLIGLALALALALGLPVPNPTRGVEYIFGPLSRLIYPR
ncbi:MAG: hypothetical protein QHH75_04125 [Bacillota bacterium]|nr:hypothetical protein [Bacillota bacterium]